MHPGGKLSAIRMKITDPETDINTAGSLLLKTGQGTIEEAIPESHYRIDGAEKSVKVRFYQVTAGVYGFLPESPIPTNATLIIDPVPDRLWGSYYGGENLDAFFAGDVDNSGFFYSAGRTSSLVNMATAGSHQENFSGLTDGILVKFNPDGARLWATYYGGADIDLIQGLIITPDLQLVVAGQTASTQNISTPGAFQEFIAGSIDAFVAKFDNNEIRIWSTYYGGTLQDNGYSCACDPLGNIFLQGTTRSTDGISTPGSHQPLPGLLDDVFLVKFDAAGNRLWGTYYGGECGDYTLLDRSCATSAAGDVYISGSTCSTTAIATSGSFQPVLSGTGTADAFLARFDANGVRQWGTYYGGEGNDWFYAAGAINGAIYAAGSTSSLTGVATAGAHQTVYGGGVWDGFLVKFTESSPVAIGFTAPDTICINHPVNIVNTTTGGSTYYWNFCSGSATNDPNGTNIGNPGSLMSLPTYITLVRQGNECYSFVSCQGVGVIRYYHGTSFTNNPITWTNLGNFGGLIPHSAEGIQVKQDGVNWYGFVNSVTTLIRLDFGNSLANTPTAVNIGPFPEFNMAHGLVIVKEGGTWLGFVTCTTGMKLIRLNFGTSLTNIPVVTDFGSFGGVLNQSTGICIIQENGLWFALVMSGNNTMSRITFGSSLLNTPTAVNLGDPGGFNIASGLTLLRDCETTTGYFTNYLPNGQLGKLTFPTGIAGTVIGTILGNIGGLARPHSFSEIFRENDNLYAYITNRDNGTLTRLTFPACTNASVPSSNLFTPPPFSYNLPGTYYIHLIVDEGLPTMQSSCKPIVAMDPPVINLGNDVVICQGNSVTLDAGALFTNYLWSTGATTRTITVSAAGDYSVTATRWGCEASDEINVAVTPGPVVDLGPDRSICSGLTTTFDAGFCAGCTYLWSNLTTGQMNIGTSQTLTTVDARPIKLHGGLPPGGLYTGVGVNTATGVFTPSVAGTGTKTITYSYTNVASCSASQSLEITVADAPAFTCGNNLIDIRDNKVYPTVQIGTQCWMQKNLEFGITIDELINQTDNCIVEKYTLNSSLLTPHSFYQWDEVMDYGNTPGVKGLCPPGWHIPDETEWNTLFNFYLGNSRAGYPLKDPYMDGFQSQSTGVFYLNTTWSFTDFAEIFWSSTMAGQTRAYAHGMNTIDQSVSIYTGVKANGFSVRCIKD